MVLAVSCMEALLLVPLSLALRQVLLKLVLAFEERDAIAVSFQSRS